MALSSSSSELMSSEANPPSGDSEIDFDSGSCTPYTKAWTTITYWTVQRTVTVLKLLFLNTQMYASKLLHRPVASSSPCLDRDSINLAIRSVNH